MKRLMMIFAIVLMAVQPAAAEQHVLFGRDWIKLNHDQKTLVLEGLVMGWFSAQEVVANEMTAARLERTPGDPGDFSDTKTKVNKGVLLQLSRIDSLELFLHILDAWARAEPDGDLPDAVSARVMLYGKGVLLKATETRGPGSGYDDIAREAIRIAASGH